MYCSGCGQLLAQGQTFCAQCGHPVAATVSPIPGYQLQLQSYAGQIRALGIVWFVYAALTFLISILGLTFARAFFASHFGMWHGPFGHGPFGAWMPFAFFHFAWLFVFLRAGLAVAAGWGLYYRTHWGRVIAIVAAIINVLHFPLGTAIAIWTLVTVLGYRNTTLYEQLPQV